MKINKQLFEDVLAGKLKGTFVLRNGNKCDFSKLHRNTKRKMSHDYPYTLSGNHVSDYAANGKSCICLIEGYCYSEEYEYDIMDFIPETNMKENELTIEIPDGKVIDWDESKKQNKIVLKDKRLTYEDVCKKLFLINNFYYICVNGEIGKVTSTDPSQFLLDANNATTEHQLECILAKNKLATVAIYLNDGWKPNKGDHVFYLTCCGDFENKPHIGEYCFGTGENLTIFKTQKDATQAIEILGEETVKLALEPLGI